MQLDWTINIGHIVLMLGFLGSLVGLYVGLKQGVAILAVKLDTFGGRMINVENDLKSINNVLRDVAVQNERMNSMEDRIESIDKKTEEHRQWVRDQIANLNKEVMELVKRSSVVGPR